MASPEPAQAMILGITLKDAITAILIPIVAVLTTLIVQARQQRGDRRMQILRMLLATRHLPASPEYNASINLIPVEFNKAEGVMNAWRAYIEAVRLSPVKGDEEKVDLVRRTKQTKLITAIMKKMKLNHSEADIQADAYASQGFVWRDNLYLDSLLATRDSADALKATAEHLRVQTALYLQQTNPQTAPPVGTDAANMG